MWQLHPHSSRSDMPPASQVAEESGAAVFALLKLTCAAADAFPPLKSVAGGALYIAEIVAKFKSNKKEWASFAEYIQDTLASIIRLLPDANQPRSDLVQNMEKLKLALDHILLEIKAMQSEQGLKRFWTFQKDPEKIAGMRKKYDDVLGLFQFNVAIITGLTAEKAMKDLDIGQLLDRIMNKFGGKIVSTIILNTALASLPYANGASWNPTLVCSPDTRVVLLESIWKWINAAEPTGAAEIFWLCDVAGSGKSAIAHTVAQQSHEKGMLGSSFFFDREISGRNQPHQLFSTIARDLVGLYPALAKDIVVVLEEEPSVSSAPLTRQFEALMLKPSLQHSFIKPVVIVIDALDEGFSNDLDTELLAILRDRVAKLPGMFRIFLTSRPKTEFDVFLLKQDHILSRAIDIHSPANLNDIEIYIQLKLQEIATWGELGEEWPDQSLSSDFTRTAEGLFIWVSTVCNYLRTTVDPNEELRLLVSKRSPRGLPAEEKMDTLYVTILNTCNWRDEAFVHGYGLLMGAIMTAKTPLSMSALQSLHGDTLQFPVKKILRPLSSLLIGLTEMDRPVRILHQSFRDFITVRARLSSDRKQFSICEKTHNQRIALLCLETLDRELTLNIAGIGYAKNGNTETLGIPELSDITEQLGYACKFWISHIVNVPNSVLNDLTAMLRKVMSTRLTLWMEVVTSKDKFQGLQEVGIWLQATSPCDYILFDKELQASTSFELSARLSYMNRREEALMAIQQATEVYRQLSVDRPAAFILNLVMSLNNLSACLSHLGGREDALMAIQEAVDVCRRLATDRPTVFSRYLASSLHNLSNSLSNLGHPEEARTAIQEAVELHRKLATDQPVAFYPNLAASLNVLSNSLSDLGHREDALTAIQEAVALRRQLATDQPAVFNPDLATSLNSFSNRLSELGCRDDALTVIQEAVELYRRLVTDRPAVFNPDLAMALDSLSRCLSDLGRREDALTAIQEAVELRRQLARDRPAAFNPSLAITINSLSNCLSYLGRREEALTAIKEAVELRRRLATDRPAVFNQDLAISLNNLSSNLSKLDYWEDALTVIQEAVELHRQLATDQPAAFNPDLALSLNNLSTCLSHLGHREDALTAIQEGVDVCRRLATDQPAAFNPVLAVSLNNLSNYLSDVGRQEDALTAIQEAVELHRQLATDRPAAFNQGFAMSLNSLSNHLSDLDRREHALTAVQDAVNIYRQLATGQPAVFNPDLALSLNNLSNCLSNLGRPEDSLTAIQEAVDVYRRLATDRPAVFNTNLATCLNNLSNHLSDLNRREDALTAIRETVELQRQLAADRPAVFNPDLAMSLNNLSNRLSDLGCREDALTAIQESVELRRQLATNQPVAFNPVLALSLNNLSDCLSNLGHREDALTAIQEVVELRRQLATDRPAMFNHNLAISLSNLSNRLSDLGRREEALTAAQNAADLALT